jgi:hypothetical protein
VLILRLEQHVQQLSGTFDAAAEAAAALHKQTRSEKNKPGVCGGSEEEDDRCQGVAKSDGAVAGRRGVSTTRHIVAGLDDTARVCGSADVAAVEDSDDAVE